MDHHHDARLAVHQSVAQLRLSAVRDEGDIFQSHTEAFMVRQYRLAERLSSQSLTLSSQRDPLVVVLDEAGTAYSGRIARGREYFIDRDAVRDQPIGTKLNLQLTHVPAKDFDARNPGDPEQPQPHHPLGKGPQFHRRS